MISVIFCQEMKLSVLRTKLVEDVVENEQEMAAALMNAAKKTLISHVMLHSFLRCAPQAEHAAYVTCSRQFPNY